MTAACNFISLGEELRELLDINGKRKKKGKRKITDHIIEQKRARNLSVVSQCFWRSARRAVNEGAQFLENFYSNHL